MSDFSCDHRILLDLVREAKPKSLCHQPEIGRGQEVIVIRGKGIGLQVALHQVTPSTGFVLCFADLWSEKVDAPGVRPYLVGL